MSLTSASLTSAGQPCLVPDCDGAIDADGFCDQCGTASDTSASSAASSKPSSSVPTSASAVLRVRNVGVVSGADVDSRLTRGPDPRLATLLAVGPAARRRLGAGA